MSVSIAFQLSCTLIVFLYNSVKYKKISSFRRYHEEMHIESDKIEFCILWCTCVFVLLANTTIYIPTRIISSAVILAVLCSRVRSCLDTYIYL